MTFLNSWMLAGLGFIAIPVLLHFLIKQRPKSIAFPAIQLIQQAHLKHLRRFQLRHLLLMVLRVLILLLLVMAVSRPFVTNSSAIPTLGEMAITLGIALLAFAAILWLRKRHSVASPDASLFRKLHAPKHLITTVTGIAVIGWFLLVGWPYQQRLSAGKSEFLNSAAWDDPVAVILLFDTSLSMSYHQAGIHRLDQSKDIAVQYVKSLPAGSRIAVMENQTESVAGFSSTPRSAINRIFSLKPQGGSRSLEESLEKALVAHQRDQQQQEELARGLPRRVVLLTDLSRSAWGKVPNAQRIQQLQTELGVSVVVVDVSAASPQQIGIKDVKLSANRISPGGQMAVRVHGESQMFQDDSLQLELLLSQAGRSPQRRATTTVTSLSSGKFEADFPVVTEIYDVWSQGEVRLTIKDSMEFDNQRYFTFQSGAAPQVVIIAPDDKTSLPWMTALASSDQAGQSGGLFEPRYLPRNELKNQNIDDVAVVTLINITQLSDAEWEHLQNYVAKGGGLIVVLGATDLSASSYNSAQAQSLLPARLESWQPVSEWQLRLPDRSHSIFSAFQKLQAYEAFELFENSVNVFRFWKVTPNSGADVVAHYSDVNQSPALLLRNYGQGRVAMLTTAVDLPDSSRQQWNDLPGGVDHAWLFVAFVEQLAQGVSRLQEENSNFSAGEALQIVIPISSVPRRLAVTSLEATLAEYVVEAGKNQMILPAVLQPGHYQLKDRTQGDDLVAAFSINEKSSETDLTRLSADEMTELLAGSSFEIVKTLEQLQKIPTGSGQGGRELFSLVMGLLLAVFLAETVLSNRFY